MFSNGVRPTEINQLQIYVAQYVESESE